MKGNFSSCAPNWSVFFSQTSHYFMRFSCFLRLSYRNLRLNSFHDFGLVSFALFCRFSSTAVLFAVSAGSMSLSKSWAITITSRSWTTSWKAQCRFSLILIQSDSCRCTWAKIGCIPEPSLSRLFMSLTWALGYLSPRKEPIHGVSIGSFRQEQAQARLCVLPAAGRDQRCQRACRCERHGWPPEGCV